MAAMSGGLVMQEGPPALAARPAPLGHILGDARLRDLEPELEQLAVNAWRSIKRILHAYPPDQSAQLCLNLRAALPASSLPVGKFHGIGKATAAKFNAFGIWTGLDIRNQSLAFLQENFDKSGSYYYWISRGIDERPLRATGGIASRGAPEGER